MIGSVDPLLLVITKCQVISSPPSSIVAGPVFSISITGTKSVAAMVWSPLSVSSVPSSSTPVTVTALMWASSALRTGSPAGL